MLVIGKTGRAPCVSPEQHNDRQASSVGGLAAIVALDRFVFQYRSSREPRNVMVEFQGRDCEIVRIAGRSRHLPTHLCRARRRVARVRLRNWTPPFPGTLRKECGCPVHRKMSLLPRRVDVEESKTAKNMSRER